MTSINATENNVTTGARVIYRPTGKQANVVSIDGRMVTIAWDDIDAPFQTLADMLDVIEYEVTSTAVIAGERDIVSEIHPTLEDAIADGIAYGKSYGLRSTAATAGADAVTAAYGDFYEGTEFAGCWVVTIQLTPAAITVERPEIGALVGFTDNVGDYRHGYVTRIDGDHARVCTRPGEYHGVGLAYLAVI